MRVLSFFLIAFFCAACSSSSSSSSSGPGSDAETESGDGSTDVPSDGVAANDGTCDPAKKPGCVSYCNTDAPTSTDASCSKGTWTCLGVPVSSCPPCSFSLPIQCCDACGHHVSPTCPGGMPNSYPSCPADTSYDCSKSCDAGPDAPADGSDGSTD